MRIYIAGPMTGYENYNFPAFDIARDRLKNLGHEPISPADMDRDLGYEPDAAGAIDNFDYKAAIKRCCVAVCDADAVYLLNGWTASKGARAEKAVAEAIGLQILYESVGVSGEIKVGLTKAR